MCIRDSYELIKTTFKPSIEYDIKITDRKHQESIVLDFAEAEQLLALKCTISVRREKSINNTSSEIVIDYPKWLTLELDSIHHLDPAAFDHQQEKNELKINTSYLFNENIRDLETFIVPLKVIPRKINNYVGNIQVKINTTPRISSLFIRSKIKGFKIKIIEG
ncbi:hypothetical protein, partial [Bacillus timonensis]|uniref:hypothetical protein n=1 Tax=Bacillus timonensis TaxID=1033734 RepID=UPI0013865FF3